MESDATPTEIYDTIRRVVEESYQYHQNKASFAQELMSKMSSPTMSEKEYINAKINANSAWNDGWTKKYYQDIVDKYEESHEKATA